MSSPPDRMVGIQAKINRAKQHANDLERHILRFRERQPYKVLIQDDPHTGDEVHYLRVDEYPDPNWALFIGDAIHNMRSALDHLAWQLVEAGGGTPNQDTQFPITRRADTLEAELKRRVKGASKDAIEAINAAKPYQGGNDALWLVHDLDIYDKHRLMFIVTSQERGVRMTSPATVFGLEFPRISVEILSAERRGGFKTGDEVFRVPASARNPDFQSEFQSTFDVAFTYGPVPECRPIMETLVQLGQYIEEFCQSFAPFLV